HSFWVPALQGKTDAVPGQTNTMWLTAERPGRYDGVCAEFCGVQHAWMRLVVVAEPRAVFDRWLARQSEDRRPPSGPAAEGERAFLGHVCVDCHTIRGTAARATVGPDLTHLAGRSLVGAGVLRNDPAALRAWIDDPQHFKPGAFMPAVPPGVAEHGPHLGCPVEWRQGPDLFFCPCHGGVSYEDGRVAAGPPRQPLFEREWRVDGDRLLVRGLSLPTEKRRR